MTKRMTVTVSLFCGAGGETLGKLLAFEELGIPTARHRSTAVNHWDLAVLTHGQNFPTVHAIREDLIEVTAADFGLSEIDLLWASPSCVHHSRARGGKPCSDQQRSHADEVIDRWLAVANVPVFLLENVPEFEDWGPLDESNRPIRERRGEFFRRFVKRLEELGYVVDWRVLCAADFGDPTSRRRLFLQAVRDGLGVTWPKPTHRNPRQPVSASDPQLPPWRSAAECIDWELPIPSIFERPRQLAEATCRRIAHGVVRYVTGAQKPFLVRGPSGELSSPLLIQTSYGERKGQAPRTLDLHQPLGTIVAGGGKHALVAAFLAKHYGGVVGQPLTSPIGTITSTDHHSLVAACLITMRGTNDEQVQRSSSPMGAPVGTVSSGGIHHALVASFLGRYYQGENTSASDLTTVVIGGVAYAVVDIGMRMLTPRELARAMGFPDWFRFEADGVPLTKRDAIKMIGNACPVGTTKALIQAVILQRPQAFGLAA